MISPKFAARDLPALLVRQARRMRVIRWQADPHRSRAGRGEERKRCGSSPEQLPGRGHRAGHARDAGRLRAGPTTVRDGVSAFVETTGSVDDLVTGGLLAYQYSFP